MEIGTLVSIQINGHREADLLVKTLRSVKLAREAAEKNRISCEVIVVLDSADRETQGLVASNRDLYDRLFEVDFKDLGDSRTFGVKHATGKYVAFIDGDDLMDPDWIVNAYAYLSSVPNSSKTVLHTEYFIGFGDEWFFRKQASSSQESFSSLDLITDWFFCNNIFAERQIYLNLPLKRLNRNNNWGGEDWLWSCDSLVAGIQHFSVPNTAYFYRRRTDLVTLGSKPGVLVPASPLFSPKNRHLWNIKESESFPEGRSVLKHIAVFIARGIEKVISKAAFLGSRGFREELKVTIKKIGSLPWAYQYWREYDRNFKPLLSEVFQRKVLVLSDIEFQLRPAEFNTKQFWQKPNPLKNNISRCYFEIVDKFEFFFDSSVIILAPWLKSGGADFLTICYAKSVKERLRRKKVVIVTTEAGDKETAWQVQGIEVIPLGTVFKKYSLSFEQQIIIISRLLLQSELKLLWVVNSYLGHSLIQRHGKALSDVFSIFVSVFGPGISSDGIKRGYAHTSIPKISDFVDCVLTDNEQIIEDISEAYKVDRSKFTCVYSPAIFINEMSSLKMNIENRKSTILWAGRLDFDKRPDILLKIADGLPYNLSIDVFGSKVIGDMSSHVIDALMSHPKINYRGPFSNFKDIDPKSYGLFLYTSNSDGLPNTLLEAGCFGLPIVASDVGGVHELINATTGVLVKNKENAAEYLDGIRWVYGNPQEAQRRALNLKRLIQERHSLDVFNDKLVEKIRLFGRDLR